MTSKLDTARRVATCIFVAALGLVSVGSAGCVVGNDSDPPTISVEFFWESDHYRDDTCSSADVAKMDYVLKAADSDEVLTEEHDRKCANGFEFDGLDLGRYVIEVSGTNDDASQTWTGTCDVSLDRFDRYFECPVNKTDS
jgi:hypothetical protein